MHRRDVLRLMGMTAIAGAADGRRLFAGSATPCHILEHEDMGMMRNFRVT